LLLKVAANEKGDPKAALFDDLVRSTINWREPLAAETLSPRPATLSG
jgi:hypothetical protein